MSKKKVTAVEVAEKSETHGRTRSEAEEGPVNVMTDRRGTQFNPELHAAMEDGTPHADSMGNYIDKASHYDGAKKAHYGDTYRHA